MAEGSTIELTDLPEIFQDIEPEELDGDSPLCTFERLLRDYKIKLASDAVQQCNGNKTLAAQKLSISRAYLHRLIRLSPSGSEDAPVTEITGGQFRISPASGA